MALSLGFHRFGDRSWHSIQVEDSRSFQEPTSHVRLMKRRDFDSILHGGVRGALPLLVFAAGSAAAQHVRIRVTDDVDEGPIPNAVISLLNEGKSVRADDAGVIVVAVAHAGPNVFTIRRLGFRPITTTLDVPAHDTLKVHVIMGAAPAALDTVSVTARSMASQFSAFEARRLRNSGGHFITREQIDSQRPIETVDLLRSMPGFRVVRPSNGGDPLIESTRGKTSPGAMGMLGTQLQGSVPCHPRIGVDGAVYGVDFPIDEIEPSKIFGIEIYDGAATLPPEYVTGVAVGGACGLIMIWTRTGGGEHPKPPPGDGRTPTPEAETTFFHTSLFDASLNASQATMIVGACIRNAARNSNRSRVPIQYPAPPLRTNPSHNRASTPAPPSTANQGARCLPPGVDRGPCSFTSSICPGSTART